MLTINQLINYKSRDSILTVFWFGEISSTDIIFR